nr:hypothetical protein Iba_chr14cCG0410 [Ipomoea batatas]
MESGERSNNATRGQTLRLQCSTEIRLIGSLLGQAGRCRCHAQRHHRLPHRDLTVAAQPAVDLHADHEVQALPPNHPSSWPIAIIDGRILANG